MAGRSSRTPTQAPPGRSLRARKSDGSWERSNDNGGMETGDHDIPTPDELMEMASTGHGCDWETISKVIDGGVCWKCVCANGDAIFGPYYCCEKCGRHFHRKCAFMYEGYPHPIFDKSLQEACKSKYKKVKLVKCCVCVVSEETQVETMKEYSKKQLNKLLSSIARFMIYEFVDSLGSPKLSTGNDAHITMPKILEKATNEEYLTVEGFFIDYQMIKFNLVCEFARESEANDVANLALARLKGIMKVAVVCYDCAINSIDERGKLYNSKEYFNVREPCPVPHLVIWIKEESYPFWPAKVLSLNPDEETMMVQYFGDRAEVKHLPFPGDAKKIRYKAYSSEYPDRKPEHNSDGYTIAKWKRSMSGVRAYVTKMRAKYGDDGVVIPVEAEALSGDLDLDECVMQMFPKYAPFPNDDLDLAEAAIEQFEMGSLQIAGNNDLVEQADDDLVPEMQGEEGGE